MKRPPAPPSPPQRSLPSSGAELVANKYRIIGMIGEGGMGSVWEAQHVELGTRVAVKFIDAEFARSSPEAVSRFRNEARAAAALHSKYVVDVYDYGTMMDGRPYIVMEHLQGESLEDRLERVGRLPIPATYRIIHQIGRALQEAHGKGIVHRDLKPDNIFLIWDEEDQVDQVKVVDFGIAKFTDDKAGVSHATQTGSVLGTPFYMSPEQARGRTDIDLRADLWSLGVVAYQCLTGELPFYSSSVGDLLVEICTGRIPVPSAVAPDLPPSIDAWMGRALTRDKELRFQSARHMTESLGECVGGEYRRAFGSLFDDQTGVNMASIRHQSETLVAPAQGKQTTGGLASMSADTERPGPFSRAPNQRSRRNYVFAGLAAIVLGGGAIGLSSAGSSAEPTAADSDQQVMDLDEEAVPSVREKTVAAPTPSPTPKVSAVEPQDKQVQDDVTALDSLPEEEPDVQPAVAPKPGSTKKAKAAASAPAPKQATPTNASSRDVSLGY